MILTADMPEEPEMGRLNAGIGVGIGVGALAAVSGLASAGMRMGVLGVLLRTLEYMGCAAIGALACAAANADENGYAPRGAVLAGDALALVAAVGSVVLAFVLTNTDSGELLG